MGETTDQQPAETQGQQTGIAWGDPISPERLAELKVMFERQRVWAENENRDIAQSVFNRVELTGADVFWLMAIAISTPDGDLDDVAIKLRAPRSPSVAWDSTLGTLPSLNLHGIRLFNAQLQEAKLPTAHLEDAYLSWAHLQGANLSRAFLDGADLSGAHLEGATLSWAQLRRANLEGAHLEDAHFDMACLEDANLSEANLQGAKLDIAQMRNANLRKTRLEGANLSSAWLERADLTGAAFDRTSRLYNTFLIDACLDQVAFNNVHLGEVVWGRTERIGEERVAREARINDDKGWRYRVAGRAYRALSLALRNLGSERICDPLPLSC